MPHRKAAQICIHTEMRRVNVQDRVQAKGIVPREAVRGTVREIIMEAVLREMVQKDVPAETAPKGVPIGMARETVLTRIRVHVFREAVRGIVSRGSALVCAQGEVARENVPNGIVTGTETVTETTAVSPMAEASEAPAVREFIGMTETLLLRQW